MPATTAEEETTRWGELFRYPRSMAAGCLTALSQTGGAGILMWITAFFVMVLKVTPKRGRLYDDLGRHPWHHWPVAGVVDV